MAEKRIKDIDPDNTDPTREDTYIATDHDTRGTEKVTLRKAMGGGFADYSDLATHTTPISVSASTWTRLTNDKLGSDTITSYLPSGVTSLWDSTLNKLDLTELRLGDQVGLRIDLVITTSAANQEVDIRLNMAGGDYVLNVAHEGYKSTGTRDEAHFYEFYIGNEATRDDESFIEILSDSSLSVVVKGFYIRVIRH